MTTHPSTDDLRDELRRQATATESWELPAVPRPQRRTSPWRAGGAVLVTAVLVVGVLLVGPAWFGGERDVAGREPTAPSSPGTAPGVERLDWEQMGPSCLADTPQCVVPSRVISDGLVLRRTVMGVGDPLGASGTPYSYRQEAGGDTADQAWVMVGVLDGAAPDGTYPRLQVDLGVAGVEVARSKVPFTLFRVGPDRPDPFRVEVSSPSAPVGGRLVIARFELAGSEPRQDWRSTVTGTQTCDDTVQHCEAPSSLVVDGLDLVLAGEGTDVAPDTTFSVGGDLGKVQQPGTWLMLGTPEPDDGGPLLVSVGGSEAVAVPVDRPVLLRLPDGAPPTYEVRTQDRRFLPLFMEVYRPAES